MEYIFDMITVVLMVIMCFLLIAKVTKQIKYLKPTKKNYTPPDKSTYFDNYKDANGDSIFKKKEVVTAKKSEETTFNILNKAVLKLKDKVLTETERLWMCEFENLSIDYNVKTLSHIRIVDVFNIDNSNSFGEQLFNRISTKHLDFLICSNDFKPLIAIELDDKSHGRPNAKASDRVKDTLFSKVSNQIIFLRINCENNKTVISDHIKTKLVLFKKVSESIPSNENINEIKENEII